MGDRNKSLRSARAEMMMRRGEDKSTRRMKNEKDRPHRILREEWEYAIKCIYGSDVDVSWSEADKALAKRLVGDRNRNTGVLKPGKYDLSMAISMAYQFIEDWYKSGKEGLPPFKLFWSKKDSLAAIQRGDAPRGGNNFYRNILPNSEYNEEKAKGLPKVGWGDLFDD